MKDTFDFYSKEQVDRYLANIRDGKVEAKDAVESARKMFNWTQIGGEEKDEHHIKSEFNTNYLPTYVAFNCTTVAGTGILMIWPAEKRNGTY